ncbi:hypothetical protein [Staphylococcus sp. Marseille-Q5304]|uniref:hypothetical protein n=1 Tax=Staphylococcus sp. Marseille-Q5304 TaxID=2942200 RepID=UPI0020745E66|nr:hypothetical protein [Staphylococcus sp. Marseille-Q5304]
MTTITEIDYQQFKILSNNTQFKKHVKENQDAFKGGLLMSLFTSPTEPHISFINQVFGLCDKHYLFINSGGIILFTRDFKGSIKFSIRKPNPKLIEHYNSAWIIEIDNLNSLKKGHGKMLLKDILAISTKLNIEACLWTETISNTRYFEKYGFESIGKLGRAKENLMIKRKEA